jgi:taurine dioxygenase
MRLIVLFIVVVIVYVAVATDAAASVEVSIDTLGHLQETLARPLDNPLYGAEILGIVVDSISSDELSFVHKQLLLHKVLVIRNQSSLSVEGMRSFTRYFGDLYSHLESQSHLNGYTDVNIVSNIRNPATGLHIGLYGAHVENFHSDLSWSNLPCKLTVLKSEIRPDGCGKTQFLDSVTAYDHLSQDWKDSLKGLKGRYCYLKNRDLEQEKGLSRSQIETASKCAVHPIVTTHPETGGKNIFANPSHTQAIEGYTKESSDQILTYLYAHTKQPKFIYDHFWQDGDLLLWDNRAVQHRATGCPDDKPRKLIRTTVLNDRVPFE